MNLNWSQAKISIFNYRMLEEVPHHHQGGWKSYHVWYNVYICKHNIYIDIKMHIPTYSKFMQNSFSKKT